MTEQPMNAIVVINPGSGPVPVADETNAVRNMQQFLADVHDHRGALFLADRIPRHDRDGRYRFLLFLPGSTETHEVDMPGWPLEQVRWLDAGSGSILDFPRLYVDGSSWVWKHAISAVTPADQED